LRGVEAAERLSDALGPTIGMRLLDVLAEAALEIGAQLPAGHVEVRLAGQEPSLVTSRRAMLRPPRRRPRPGLAARIRLRLPESLEASVEEAAAGKACR
jgi:hypothetical protein